MTIPQDESVVELQPLLPPELEKEIFEVLALSSLTLIPKLVLVSKRVRIWLEPLLYKHLSVCDPHFRHTRSELLRISSDEYLEILNSKPASFLRDHVHHLAMANLPDATVERALSSCTEIRSNAASFSRLTHLEIFGPQTQSATCWPGDLSRLPALTHLLIHWSPEEFSEPPLRDILAECRALEVLIRSLMHEKHAERYGYFADDVRAVTWLSKMFLDEWEKSMLGGEDHWFLADAFVHRRQTGQQNAAEYAIPRNWRPYV
ncbi:hypothetical protein C8R45DRAFT_1132315 [Mycena sanguinolenta]|nr:hypothetical protein C8R45DRAFT_1132315 [Mycena sanguinolenta]